MGWELTIRSPTGGFQRTFTHEHDENPVESIEAVVDAGGSTNTITVRGLNIGLQIAPRSILEYTAWTNFQVAYQGARVTFQGKRVTWRDNRAPLAAGVVVTSPPLNSPGSGPADRDADALDRITAVGLEQLVRERIVGRRFWFASYYVWQIALQLCQDHAPPAVVVNPENFAKLGDYFLERVYMPERTLGDALTVLLETLPGAGTVTWFVNARREIDFQLEGA